MSLEIKSGEKAVARAESQGVERAGALINIGQLANVFASICGTDLDKNLTPKEIKDRMIKQGFPAGLAVTLGTALLKQIADARESLSVAARKPQLKASLIASVEEDIIKYFGENQEVVNIFLIVSQNPVASLDAAVNVLSTAEVGGLSPEDLKTFLDSIKRLLEEGTQKFLESIGQTIVLLAKEKLEEDAVVKKSSLTGIYLNFDSEKNRENFFTYLESIFPSLKFSPTGTKITDKEWRITFNDNTRDEFFSSLRRR